MLVEPDDLTASRVLAVVRAHWDPHARSCAPLLRGASAHHWVVSGRHRPRWFVTADDVSDPDREDELRATYAAARDLAPVVHQVVPPVPLPAFAAAPASGPLDSESTRSTHGATRVNLVDAESTPGGGGRGDGVGVREGYYLVTVTRWLEGEAGAGPYAADDQRALIARALGSLHAAPPPSTLRAWEPGPPQRAELLALLGRLEEPWVAGPFGESVRKALQDNALQLRDLVARFDGLAAAALAGRDRWVPTHGEPHPANVLWTQGGPVLVDWESLRLAPRERDLREVLRDAEGPEPLSAYLAMTGAALDDLGLDADLVELFDLERWLRETASCAVRFHEPHPGDADDERLRAAFLGEMVPAVGRS